MKKSRLLILLLFTLVFFQSCKKNKKENASEKHTTQDDAKYAMKLDKLTDDVFDIIDINVFNPALSEETLLNSLPSCVSCTINGVGNHVEIIFEFDSNGCVMSNGSIISGTLKIIRNFNFTSGVYRGSISFDNFYVNDINIKGSSDFVRIINENSGNPETTYNYSCTYVFFDGDVAKQNGEKIREWTEGYFTPQQGDNVFLINGNTHILKRNGTELNLTVTTPLRCEFVCPYFVSGTMDITKNGNTATLDYGDGTCDNEVTLILSNGQIIVIHL